VTHGGFGTSTVSFLVKKAYSPQRNPVHPAILLTVAARMRWSSHWRSHAIHLFEYPLFMSPYIMTLDGKEFILTLRRDEKGKDSLVGELMILAVCEHLPRCMHVYENRKPDSSVFVKKIGDDNMYQSGYLARD
jgi:hypothetical protein